MYIIYINYIYTVPKQSQTKPRNSYWNVLGSLHPLPDQLEQPLSTRSYPHGISRSLTALSKLVSTARFLGSYPVISSHIETCLYSQYSHIGAQLVHSNILKSLTVRNWKFSGCGSMHSHSLLVLIDCYQPSWSHGRYHVVQEVVAFTQNSVPEKLHGLT